MTAATLPVASVDWSHRVAGRGYDVSAERPTKYHVPRSDDPALARCSRHVLLNADEGWTFGEVGEDAVCRRCLRTMGTL